MADEPEPLDAYNFVQVTARQTWSNLPLVIAGGLLFSLACAPAAVLGFIGLIPLAIVALALLVSPAWAALLWMLDNVAADRAARFGQLPGMFARFWLPSVRVSLLFAVPLLAGWMLRPWIAEEQVPAEIWLVLFAVLLGLALAWSIALYAYPLLVTQEMGALDAIRNGAILASRHPMNTVGMVSMAALGMVATGVVGIALLLFLPGLYGMFVVNNFRLVMRCEMDT